MAVTVVAVLVACGRSRSVEETAKAPVEGFREALGCITDTDCGNGSYCYRPFVPGIAPIGPGNCKAYVAAGGKCIEDDAIYRCAPGLTCNLSTKVCEGSTTPIPVTPIATPIGR